MADAEIRPFVEEYYAILKDSRENVSSAVAAHVTATRLADERRRQSEEEKRSCYSALTSGQGRVTAAAEEDRHERERTRGEIQARREAIIRKRVSLAGRSRAANLYGHEQMEAT